MAHRYSLRMLFVMLCCLAPFAGAQVESWQEIKIPPLPAFHPQEPRRIALSNGMVIFLQEDHELPFIRATARIRGGSRNEPADKVGLTSIYGEVWRTGGTTSRTGDQLDDFLEERAAHVETGGGVDSTTISFDCLKGNLDEVFAVFMELLKDPAFRAGKIPLAQDQLNTSISRRNDSPAAIVSREANLLGYGKDSPYARLAEYSTVAAVTRDDLVNWYKTYVHPNNLILGVDGDFDPQAMESRLRKAFADWPQGPAAVVPHVAFPGPQPGVYFVEKNDVNQSNIRAVEMGTERNNPDYYAIEVLNQILGGSFSSRLMQDIRTDKGLAYSVGGGITTHFDHPGLTQFGMGTKSQSTAAAIQALLDDIEGMKTKPATPDEMKKAKDAILNSFVFEFDTTEKVLSEKMAYEFYGYPLDFMEKYRAGIEKVTAADVSRVAEKYLHRDRLAIVVVGKAADFDKPLSTFGPVTTLDITIPAPPGAGAEAPAASTPEGKSLLAKIVQGFGGPEKVLAVKSLRQKVNIAATTPRGEFTLTAEQVVVLPDRLWQKLGTPGGDITMVVGPDASFMQGAMGSRDLPPWQSDELRKEMKLDPFYVAQHADDPSFAVAVTGNGKVGDTGVEVLSVKAGDSSARWFVDPQSGHILRSVTQAMGPSGPSERVTDFADWRTVNGITMPFKETRTMAGKPESVVDIQDVEFNPAVDPKIFEKPPAAAEK
jgi:zinc protease